MNKIFQFSLAFCIFIITKGVNAQENIPADKIIAVVGKEIVLLSDVEKQVLEMQSQGYYTSGDIKCEVLEQLLFSKLMVYQAKLDSVEISDPEVNDEMQRRLNMFISQIGSEKKLEEFYGKSISEIKKEFKEVIADQLLISRLQQKVTADLKVTPKEIRNFFDSLHKDSIPMINTQFEIDQIVMKPKVQELEVLRIQDKLREFRKRVAKGESFATLAVLYSEDKGTAPKGGELGFVNRGDLVPEFSAVAFNLEEGQVSKIVKTDYGYHIIQLIEKQGERINCRHILLKPKVSIEEKQKAVQKLDSVKNIIKKDEITFKEACWKYSESEETRLNGGVMINPMTGDTRWEANSLRPKIAYAIKNLKVGEISAPFESEDKNGNAIFQIVLLKTKTDPHRANIDEDYEKIQQMALEKKQGEFMEGWVSKKVKTTYLKVDKDFKNCKFKNKIWEKR